MLFTQKQAQFGVSPNDVQLSRLNQKIKSQETAITNAEHNVTQSALRVQRQQPQSQYEFNNILSQPVVK